MVTGDHADAHVEDCQNCGKRVIYNKDKVTGRIDNEKYLRDHLRDFLQPRGETRDLYALIYGADRIQAREKQEKEMNNRTTSQEIRDEAQDMLQTMKRKSTVFG